MQYEIGMGVRCSDGEAGEILALVTNPLHRRLAHVAVGDEHEPTEARLVPVELVESVSGGVVQLTVTREELAGLPEFHDVEFVPYLGAGDPSATLAWPYYGTPSEIPAVVDRVPAGEVEIRRGDHVQASDGGIGHVEGLVADADGLITHVLLQEGHLWTKREVAIPVGSVEKIDADGIHLRLSKHEVGELPEIGARPA
jgi:hypothetical protein